MYLAPVNSHSPRLRHPMFGCVATPEERRPVPDGVAWGADCGLKIAKSNDPADVERYIDWLETLPYDRSRCLYAVAPDVLGDAAATWRRSAPWLPLIRDLGYPAALVAQDGFDADAVDWSLFDVLFVGGRPLVTQDTLPSERRRVRAGEWKRSERGGFAAIREGKLRGKWVHVGRVNGGPFLRQLSAAGADSADGSLLTKSPEKWWPLIRSWLDDLNRQPLLDLEATA